MRLARVQHTLLLALAAGEGRSRDALISFNAGAAHILEGNREATDTELLALETLADQVTTKVEGEADDYSGLVEVDEDGEEPSSGDDAEHSLAQPPLSPDGAEGGASAPQGEVTQPGAEAPVSAPSAPSAGEQALNRAADFQAQRPLENVVEIREPVDLGLTETVTSPPFHPQEDENAEHVDDSDGA